MGPAKTFVGLHIPFNHKKTRGDTKTMAYDIVILALIPLFLALTGLAFFMYGFHNKTWPPPLIAFLLLVSAAITSMSSSFTICQGITCDDFQIIIPELTYIFGGLSLLALILLFLRAFTDIGNPKVEY